MKKSLLSIIAFLFSINTFALTESEAFYYVRSYYSLLTKYATSTIENISVAKRIGGMHVKDSNVYPDVEINLGNNMPEIEGVGIESQYLASINYRRNLSLNFTPKNISFKGNNNGICTIVYTLDVYSRDTLKYSVPLKMEIRNKDNKIISILKKTDSTSSNYTPSAHINSVSVSQGQDFEDGKGIIIHVSFDIQNMNGKNGRISAYFYDSDGNALIDINGKYCTDGGKVSTGKDFKPPYDNSTYKDLTFGIPYSELHQSGTYSITNRIIIVIWNKSVFPNKEIFRSSYTTFSYIPISESILKVDNSTSDKKKIFSESGGRETYYVSTNVDSYETRCISSWCRIEDKNSSSFTLVCEPNTTFDDRSGYMEVMAGGKAIRIDIRQEGKSSAATVEKCWFDSYEANEWDGRTWVAVRYKRIHCRFTVAGHKGEFVRVCAYFYDADGKRANARHSFFSTSDGYAAIQRKTNKLKNEINQWDDYTLDIPYSALPVGKLSVSIQIQDENGGFLAKSSNLSL